MSKVEKIKKRKIESGQLNGYGIEGNVLNENDFPFPVKKKKKKEIIL